MKYRKTFREALNDMDKKDKPEAKPEVADEKPVEDKDATIKSLKDQVTMLQMKLENEKNKVVKPVPNKDTGEVPLRTGVAQALLDKSGKNRNVIAKKEKKENQKNVRKKSLMVGKTWI